MIFYLAFVTIFIGLVVLGHILLISAIYKCLRDDWAAGRRSNRKPPPSMGFAGRRQGGVGKKGAVPTPSIANRGSRRSLLLRTVNALTIGDANQRRC